MLISPHATYKDYARRRQLAYQIGSDGGAVFYPRILDLNTGEAPQWKVSDGRGKVYATTVLHERDGSTRNIALILLDEGFRMMSRVEEIDPTAVRIGLPVRVVFREQEGEDAPLAVFIPQEIAE